MIVLPQQQQPQRGQPGRPDDRVGGRLGAGEQPLQVTLSLTQVAADVPEVVEVAGDAQRLRNFVRCAVLQRHPQVVELRLGPVHGPDLVVVDVVVRADRGGDAATPLQMTTPELLALAAFGEQRCRELAQRL